MTVYNLPEKKYDDWKKACHDGTIHILSAGNVHLWGGGTSRGATIWQAAVILNLTGFTRRKIETLGDEFASFEKYNSKYRGLEIDWPDFGVLSVDVAFWTDLVDTIKRIEAAEGEVDVIAYCIGGHGRTGTCVTILGCLLGGIPDDVCPVKYVRDNYCINAVESISQIEYIEKVTGRKVTAGIPIKSYGGYSTSGGWWESKKDDPADVYDWKADYEKRTGRKWEERKEEWKGEGSKDDTLDLSGDDTGVFGLK